MGNHALLSASSSHRWLNCPPSARLGENYEDKGSDFAAEGTDAHSLCEHKLKTALGIPSEDPTENLTWYNEEMEECASGYAAYVLELLAEAKKVTTDPIVLIEQRLDYSKYVESGFGTGDCVLIADGTLNIVDYKHGKGVEVSADHNPQMMLYTAFSIVSVVIFFPISFRTWLSPDSAPICTCLHPASAISLTISSVTVFALASASQCILRFLRRISLQISMQCCLSAVNVSSARKK